MSLESLLPTDCWPKSPRTLGTRLQRGPHISGVFFVLAKRNAASGNEIASAWKVSESIRKLVNRAHAQSFDHYEGRSKNSNVESSYPSMAKILLK